MTDTEQLKAIYPHLRVSETSFILSSPFAPSQRNLP
jgi:hypothetical protein